MRQKVLFDGWELFHAPLSSPALHLLDLAAHFPADNGPEIAIPGERPDWLPAELQVHAVPTPHSPAGRQKWEQRVLPQLAVERDAALHTFTNSAALTASQPVFVSPAPDSSPPTGSFRNRLRRAIGRGGMARARILWPEDVPAPLEHASPTLLTPAVHPHFTPKNYFRPPEIPGFPALPESFFLLHTRPDPQIVRRTLEAWTWASGPIGDVYPLLFLGLPDNLVQTARRWMRELHLGETVMFYPAPAPTRLPLVYQTASAVFHPAEINPWSSPLRYAIACAKPFVGLETAVSNAIAGPAAYFAPADDPRRLGAALITVIVRDDIRKQLIDHTRHRAASWDHDALNNQLEKMYSGN